MKKIKFTKDDLWPLINILNEVCNGIQIDNFEKCIGADRQVVEELLDRISKEEDEQEIAISLNASEVTILLKSFAEVFRQIEEWEFQTRIGISVQDAEKIKNKL